MTTTADTKISEAKQALYNGLNAIEEAYSKLREALDPNTSGSGEFRDSYRDELIIIKGKCAELSNEIIAQMQKL